jgi:phosphatidylinositol-3-phosphatase
MNYWPSAAVIALTVASSAARVHAVCDVAGADAAAFAATRSAIAATCSCTGAASHREYSQCAARVIRSRVQAGGLSRICASMARRCAARSVCGRADAVTCCRINSRGHKRCTIKRDATRCTAPSKGTACVGRAESCCDACADSGCTTSSTTTTTLKAGSTTSTTQPTTGHHIKTVFIIMLENHDWSSIKGNSSAPYINGTLLPAFAHAENYRTGGQYPSLPNYITLEAGDDMGLAKTSPLPTDYRIGTADHLTTYLQKKSISWKSYSENLPGTGASCVLVDGTLYSVDHNAFSYFNDVTGNPPSASNTYCITHVRPYSEFADDLRNNTVACYNFIIPNDANQGEKAASPGSSKVKQCDTWLATEVPRIQASRAYQDGGAILIVWDEGATHGVDNPIGLIVVSPLAKVGYSNTLAYSHGSTLRTVQEIFGVTPLLRKAATAIDLGDLFTTFP